MIEDYELICFDAGGTLLRPYPSVGEIYSTTAEKYGCIADPKEIENRFRKLWHRRDISRLVSHSDEKIERDWWYVLVKEVFSYFDGIRDFECFFDELYCLFAEPHCWKLFPETLDVLRAVKRRGKRLGIISNWDSRLQILCESLGIRPCVDFILISAVYGASKPSPRIFREALRHSGVCADRAVHIGDSMEDDIGGAKAAGMAAVLIDRHARYPRPEDPENGGPVVIRDLRELLSGVKNDGSRAF